MAPAARHSNCSPSSGGESRWLTYSGFQRGRKPTWLERSRLWSRPASR